MRLTDLCAKAGLTFPNLPDLEIRGVESDSRKVEPGFLFVAITGVKQDGHQYIHDAVQRGAVAVLTSAPPMTTPPEPVLHLLSSDPRLALAKLAAVFYAPLPETLVAVTGTNGKTSTVTFAAQLWQHLGLKAASIGTMGLHGSGIDIDGSLTTPDPATLARNLHHLHQNGIHHAALEASSHGIEQKRLDGLTFKAAGFTYLGRDHLDYHGTVDKYFEAKTGLFSRLLSPNGTAILNRDTPQFEALESITKARRLATLTYGRDEKNDLCLVSATPLPQGLGLQFKILGEDIALTLPVIGAFQAENILCALGLVIGAGTPAHTACAQLDKITSVRGRMELVGTTAAGAGVYVDYAHTPDALETVLLALRPHTANRLHVVFGCGGDRDAGKRPLMGEIANRLADQVYVTDDNPRTEAAGPIRQQILNACPRGQEVADRAEAIQTAIAALQGGDTLIIAGKGHEQGQIVGTVTRPFDDAQIARAAL